MLEKYCPKCKTTKPVSEFYKNHTRKDGLAGWCKKCHIAATSTHKKTEKGKAKERRYLAGERGRAYRRKWTLKYRAEHPERYKATTDVNNAIKLGRLSAINTQRCAKAEDNSFCETWARHYHHEDYSEPLEVIPLCGLCHRSRHTEIAEWLD